MNKPPKSSWENKTQRKTKPQQTTKQKTKILQTTQTKRKPQNSLLMGTEPTQC